MKMTMLSIKVILPGAKTSGFFIWVLTKHLRRIRGLPGEHAMRIQALSGRGYVAFHEQEACALFWFGVLGFYI